MTVEIDLTSLIKEQFQLDTAIQNNHNVTYSDTYEERKLALLVELGEFANTTRCFKFWSNKGPDIKERVLDEAADCLHFYLSLMICDNDGEIEGNWKKSFELIDGKVGNKKLTNLFRKVIEIESENLSSFKEFLNIIYGLGYRWSDLEDAYYKKLKVNYDRQDNNY